MPKYMFAYHGGRTPQTQDEIDRSMAAWGAWMEANQSALADPGNPVGLSKTVSGSGIADNGGANPLSGYSIVTAESIEAACEMAKSNPMIADGGSVEVAEIHVIDM